MNLATQTISNWESGQRKITALRALSVARLVGVDLEGAFRGLDQSLRAAPRNDQEMGEWLSRLSRERSVGELASRLEVSRYRVSRWLSGDTKIPLPHFLELIHLLTRRLTDWVAALVSIESIPLLAPLHRQLESARALAFERPLSAAILRLAETQAYAALRRHEVGWFARRLRVSLHEESECLAAMVDAGILEFEEGCYRAGTPMSVDTGASVADMKHLKGFWLDAIRRSLDEGRAGNTYGYNVVSVSENDLDAIRALQLRYFQELRAIVVESEPVETTAIIGMQIVEVPAKIAPEKSST